MHKEPHVWNDCDCSADFCGNETEYFETKCEDVTEEDLRIWEEGKKPKGLLMEERCEKLEAEVLSLREEIYKIQKASELILAILIDISEKGQKLRLEQLLTKTAGGIH